MPGLMSGILSAIHIFACIALVVSILLQSGKGGGLAGAFGAGSSQTLFGGRGAATFLTRATTTLAVIFFLTSLTLGLSASHQTATAGRSLMQEEAKRRAEQQRGTGEPSTPSSSPAGGATSPGAAIPGGSVAPQGATAPGTMMPTPGNTPSKAPGTSATQNGGKPQTSGTK
jgi:preprotein translocase subunit SecG